MVGYTMEKNESFHLDGMVEFPAYFPNGTKNANGGNAVGIPGTVFAMERLLNDYGTMTLAEVLAPAIGYAKNGWLMNERVYEKAVQYRDKIIMYPATAAIYLDPFGQPYKPGTIIRNPDLAITLELIAQYGSSVFYDNTTITKSIVQAIQLNPYPGFITEEDIQLYRAVYRKPVTWNFAGLEFIGPNYPTLGGQMFGETTNILNLLLQEDESWDSVKSLQTVLNTLSLTYADALAYLGDPDFVDGLPIDNQLLQASYAQQRASLINRYNKCYCWRPICSKYFLWYKLKNYTFLNC